MPNQRQAGSLVASTTASLHNQQCGCNMGKIRIENLKSITLLEFEIPSSGVHILTGINGSGKTTLLACLQRLTDSYSFQRHFRTSSNNQFDNFRNARIRYEQNGAYVDYAYKNTRWSTGCQPPAGIKTQYHFQWPLSMYLPGAPWCTEEYKCPLGELATFLSI